MGSERSDSVMPTLFRQLRFLIKSDFYRYDGASGLGGFLRTYLSEPGARFTFWLRLAACLRDQRLWWPLLLVARWFRWHYEVKFGLSVPHVTTIGPGLYFSHFGGVVVNGRAVIGKNCNLGHGVTIGQANRGSREGAPTIGDNVFIGPGAKIIGRVKIGSHAAIGANAVVTSDVPERAVAVGIPAKVISLAGSEGYVDWTDYEGNDGHDPPNERP